MLGLWIARLACARGLAVAIADPGAIGGGASATPLGALLPHLPDTWNEKKAFQFAALADLADAIARLEADTGLSTGYRRAGRVMPIRDERFLQKAERARTQARAHWGERFALNIGCGGDAPSSHGITGDAAPLGIVSDTLSAHIDARALTTALRASLAGPATLIEGTAINDWDAARGVALDADGDVIASAGALVVAAGFGSFALLRRLTGLTLGDGVKGHAVVLSGGHAHTSPVIYDGGTYVIGRPDGTTAVGATTEFDWTTAAPRDSDDIDALLARATELVPALKSAQRVSLWSGIRPRAVGRDPLVGCLNHADRVWVATGGYKITLGIAHLLAAALVGPITAGEGPITLPKSFSPEHHIAAAHAKAAKRADGDH